MDPQNAGLSTGGIIERKSPLQRSDVFRAFQCISPHDNKIRIVGQARIGREAQVACSLKARQAGIDLRQTYKSGRILRAHLAGLIKILLGLDYIATPQESESSSRERLGCIW